MAAIAFLIVIDLGLSGGDHLSRNLLRTENSGELWELVSRRYELAFRVLKSGRTPAYFLGAALAVAFALRNRGGCTRTCRTARGRRCSWAAWPPASRAR